MAILQSINIALFLVAFFIMPYTNPGIWFLGGFFMLLIQFPLFVIFLLLQIGEIRELKAAGSPIDWKTQLLPVKTFGVCLGIIFIATLFHLNDPFYGDAYRIEVEFFADKTCSVKMDGTIVAEKMRYSDKDGYGREIYCSNEHSSVLVNLDTPRGRLVSPGAYQLTDEIDSRGYSVGNGGAYFDDALGIKLNSPVIGYVYWDFVSGTFTIISVTKSDTGATSIFERTPALVGKLTAVGKRKHRGP